MQAGQAPRNVGIDILKLMSMAMVCVLHVNLGLGITQEGVNPVWESLAIVAVNLFALVTGYLHIGSRWKIKRYFSLWLQVASYSCGLLVMGIVLGQAGLVHGYEPDCENALFPVPLASGYWYFTAYSGLYFLLPFVNRFLRTLEKREFQVLVVLGAVILPAMSTAGGGGEIFQGGYNVAWLLCLYIVGGYIRKYPPLIGRVYWVLLYVVATCAVSALSYSSLSSWAGVYVFPLNVFSSISLFVLLSAIPGRSSKISACLSYLSPLAFGVYLFHVHPLTWLLLRRGLGIVYHVVVGPVWWFVPVAGVCLFVLCLGVDWCRAQLFRLLRVNALAERMANACPQWLKDLEKL